MSIASPSLPDLEQYGPSKTHWWTMIAAVLLILYELGWVTPWFQVMMGVSTPPDLVRSVLLLGGIYLFTYLVTRLMEMFRLLRQIQLTLLGILLLVGLAVGEITLWTPVEMELSKGLLNLDLGILIIAGYIVFTWYRGFTLAYDGVRPNVVWKRFRLGLLAMMAYIFFVFNWKLSTPGLGYAMAFLFIGLLALILTRITYVGLTRGAQRSPYDWRWFLGVIGALSLVIVTAGLVGSLLSGQYAWVLDLVNQIVDWARMVILLIIGIPAVLVSFILWPFINWLNGILSAQTIDPEILSTGYPGPYMNPVEEVATGPNNLVIYLTALCFWGGLALLAAFLYLRTRRAWVGAYNVEPESAEDLLEQGEAGRMVRQALKNAWEEILDRLKPVQRQLAAARVRRIYQELLDLCETHHLPRPLAHTPLEFLPEMIKLFPGSADDLSVITQAYVRVRYGEYPESREEVEAVEAAWRRVSEAETSSTAQALDASKAARK
jgi:hypothetical protein